MQSSTVSLAVLLALMLTSIAGAQTPIPPRDRRVAPPSGNTRGTAVITGRVVDGATGLPLARARVRLNSAIGEPVLVTTDNVGTFRFTRLPPGEYSLTADKSTYKRVSYPSAAETLRRRLRPLNLADGQTVAGLTLVLFRASAIAGRVVDPNGDPVDFAELGALRLSTSGRGTQTQAGATTNDVGEFRLTGLESRPLSPVRPAAPRDAGRFRQTASHSHVLSWRGFARSSAADRARAWPVGAGHRDGDDRRRVVDRHRRRGRFERAARHRWRVGQRTGPAQGAANGWAADSTSVNADGTFQLKLPPGEYDLQVKADGAGIASQNQGDLQPAIDALRGGGTASRAGFPAHGAGGAATVRQRARDRGRRHVRHRSSWAAAPARRVESSSTGRARCRRSLIVAIHGPVSRSRRLAKGVLWAVCSSAPI